MPEPLITQKQTRYQQDIDRVRSWFKTRSGKTVTSRLIRADDADLLIEFFRRLSPESRRRRFHQNVEHLTEEVLQESAQLFVSVDNQTVGGAVLALEKAPDGTPAIIGVARLGRPLDQPNDPVAEAAIVIRDDYHGQGIGTELLRRLVLLAKRMQVKQMLAVFEVDNTSAIRLFRELGLPTEIETSHGGTTMMIDIPN